MKEWLGSILAPLGDRLLAVVTSVPLGVVRLMFLAILALLAWWALSLGPQLPEGERGKIAVLKDLRLFALVLLILQVIPYLIF